MDWEDLAKPWLASAPHLEKALRPVQDVLMAAAALRPGLRVLDVGFGTGPTLIMAREALGERGHLSGIDIAPPLVARAAERVPADVTLITGDAGTYPFEEGAFDTLISNFGIMFFDDTRAALSNLRRATQPGGRLVATIWGLPRDNPYFALPRQVVTEFIPDLPAPDPKAPGPMRFGDPTDLMDDLAAAGWDASLETHDLLLTPPGTADSMVEIARLGPVGRMLEDHALSDETSARLDAALGAAFATYQTPDGLRIPARIHVVTAHAV